MLPTNEQFCRIHPLKKRFDDFQFVLGPAGSMKERYLDKQAVPRSRLENRDREPLSIQDRKLESLSASVLYPLFFFRTQNRELRFRIWEQRSANLPTSLILYTISPPLGFLWLPLLQLKFCFPVCLFVCSVCLSDWQISRPKRQAISITSSRTDFLC